MKKVRISIALVLFLILVGCGTGISVKSMEKRNLPAWLETTEIFWENNGNYYFKHYTEYKADYSYSHNEENEAMENFKNVAEMQAIAAIAERIRSNVKSSAVSIKSSSRKKNSNDSFDNYGIAKTKTNVSSSSAGLLLKGISVEDIYTQKSIVSTGSSRKTYYRCFVLVRISKHDYETARKKVFENER